ncbi:MAG TPA: endonuclease/exonuclease/phosphatase family protein, partial [Clostridia bacterium]|nr:endonuclease/exonuclease/phosphatase family protein [Clostridia bacterium]
MKIAKHPSSQFPMIALNSILLLVFLQLLSDFVEAIYAFGLMGTNIPVEIVFVLYFFSPLILLVAPRAISGWPLILLGELILACRIIEALLNTRGTLIFAGLGVACFLVFLPSYFLQQRAAMPPVRSSGFSFSLSLGLSLLFSILLRTIGSGYDVSTYGLTQAIGWLLAALAGSLLILTRHKQDDRTEREPQGEGDQPLSAGKTITFSLGLISVFLVLYFTFVSPHVMARWTGESHVRIIIVLTLVLALFGLGVSLKPGLLKKINKTGLVIWNGLFVAALTLTMIANQIRFPDNPAAYPLQAPTQSWIHLVFLYFAIILCPVVFVDVMLYVDELIGGKPTRKTLGAGISIASVYFLFMIFAQVFTTVYDYIPVVGPFFRDKFWLVFLVAGLFLALPVLLTQKRPIVRDHDGLRQGVRTVQVVLSVLAVATIVFALTTAARPRTPAVSPRSLKVVTYNIQQGYSEDGQEGFDQQLSLLRELDADVIGLQESDNARIAGGNADIVRYFADKLGMYSYYGPKTVVGTFGIALLSKHPIHHPQTHFMFSEGEQTAMIQASIHVGDKDFNIFVTHLG